MKRFATAALLAFAATTAYGDEITLNAPMEGATMHDGGIDMTVYWIDVGTGFEVTATYTPQDTYAPARMVMLLADGDKVTFSLPGHKSIVYSFSRDGQDVRVMSNPANTTELAEG